jgi:L-histidine N-alpha-methyltransferase
MLLGELRDGLARRQRELPATLLGDAGAAPLRRRVHALSAPRLEALEAPLVADVLRRSLDTASPRTVVQIAPGTDDGDTIDTVLVALAARRSLDAFFAVDPIAEPVREACARVRETHPDVMISGAAAELTCALPLPAPNGPRLFVALGNAIGAHATVGIIRLLRTVRAAMLPGDALVLGLDTRRDAALLEAELGADAEVRAAYHRHALVVANRELGADFALDAFAYRARYEPEYRRVALGLAATRACKVVLPGAGTHAIRRGELLRTGVRTVHERASFTALLAGVGLALDTWVAPASGEHAVALALPAR